jgi:hypothetical protein
MSHEILTRSGNQYKTIPCEAVKLRRLNELLPRAAHMLRLSEIQ